MICFSPRFVEVMSQKCPAIALSPRNPPLPSTQQHSYSNQPSVLRGPQKRWEKSDLISRSSALAASASAFAFAYVCFSFPYLSVLSHCVVVGGACSCPPHPQPSPLSLPPADCPAFILFCVHVTCWKINNNKKAARGKRTKTPTQAESERAGGGGQNGGVGVGATNTRVTLLNVC